MRLSTRASFAGVTAENVAPDFTERMSLVYRLSGGEMLHFPTPEKRTAATWLKNAPRTLIITATEEAS